MLGISASWPLPLGAGIKHHSLRGDTDTLNPLKFVSLQSQGWQTVCHRRRCPEPRVLGFGWDALVPSHHKYLKGRALAISGVPLT